MTFKLRKYWILKGSSRTFNRSLITLLIRTLSPGEVKGPTQHPQLVSYRVGLGLRPQMDELLSSLPLLQQSLHFLLPSFSSSFFQCEIHFTLIIIAPIH